MADIFTTLSLLSAGAARGYRTQQELARQLREQERKAALEERQLQLQEREGRLREALIPVQIETEGLRGEEARLGIERGRSELLERSTPILPAGRTLGLDILGQRAELPNRLGTLQGDTGDLIQRLAELADRRDELSQYGKFSQYGRGGDRDELTEEDLLGLRLKGLMDVSGSQPVLGESPEEHEARVSGQIDIIGKRLPEVFNPEYRSLLREGIENISSKNREDALLEIEQFSRIAPDVYAIIGAGLKNYARTLPKRKK